ncbi:MAG: diheme cytochrome c-553 [Chitinophagaceae bacterium]|nr:diheme cytochrome c-553 [Chitinophagaceae bacterium]
MKKTILILALFTGTISFALIACTSSGAKQNDNSEAVLSQDSLIKRGSYLVNAMGCDDCHSPKTMGPNGPELDMEHRFGGHLANAPLGKPNTSVMKDGYMLFAMDLTSAVGPWGQSYAANISSDETGIGNWSEEQFFRAIREGKSKGLVESRPLLPPMPWFVYKNLNDTDLKAIFAFLKSTKPVQNVVPGPKALAEL